MLSDSRNILIMKQFSKKSENYIIVKSMGTPAVLSSLVGDTALPLEIFLIMTAKDIIRLHTTP